MEFLLRNVPNDYLYKKEYMDLHSAEIETLILGSSHSFYGLNPAYFSSKTFNASHISQSLNYDFAIIQKYQTNLGNLKTIILPISYFTLFYNLEESSESWRMKNYVIYYEINSAEPLIYHSEVLSNRMFVNTRRLVSYYILGKPQTFSTDLGWGTNYKSDNAGDLYVTGKKAASIHSKKDINTVENRIIFQNNINIFNNIVQYCKDRNVSLIVLTPPAYITYRQNLNTEQLEATFDSINRITLSYEGCTFLNLLSDTSFLAKDFFDADHLSEIGAEKLSTLINEKIIAQNKARTHNIIYK